MAPPDFGRSVNPISTKGGRLCPPNNTGTPGFSDLPTALSSVGRGGEAQLKVIISSGEAKAKRRAAAAIWGRKVRKDWLIKDHFLYIRTIVPPYFMYKVHTTEGLSEPVV